MTPLAGVELESLVSEPDALTTRPLAKVVFFAGWKQTYGTQWHENPQREWIQPIGKKQALTYVLERSKIVS